MTDTWLPWCTRRPGPTWKRGYNGVIRLELGEIEGEVDHSTEGPLEAAFGVLAGERTASWTFTIDWDGTAYQHYALEDICWHCGLPGDRRTDTSLIGNITLRGIEHVDRLPNGTMLSVLTPPQIATSVRITQEIRRLCPRVAANLPTLRRNLWEHNWLSATSCPSGLIPWAAKFAALEDDMTWTEVEKAELLELARWFKAAWRSPGGAATVRDTILFNAHNLGAAFFNENNDSNWPTKLVRKLLQEELAKLPVAVPAPVNYASVAAAIVTALKQDTSFRNDIALAVADKLDIKVD